MPSLIAIVAGGTGGHVIPALSIANAFARQGHKILWLGTETGIEHRLVPEAGYEFISVPIVKVSGQGLANRFKLPAKMLSAVRQLRATLKEKKPDLVVAMGSYVSVAPALAAKSLKIPLVIHEQNAVAGRANRLLSRFASRVLYAFPEAFEPSKRMVITGNPVRPEIKSTVSRIPKATIGPLNILIIGGSQGADALNKMVPMTLARFPLMLRPKVWHQAGAHDVEALHLEYKKANIDARVCSFIDDMSEAYAWADVMIARAGAMTIAELTTVGLPSILVPYPYASDNHQLKNAQHLENKGAAVVLEEKHLSSGMLYEELLSMVQNPQRRMQLQENAKQLSAVNATKEVVKQCIEVIRVST